MYRFIVVDNSAYFCIALSKLWESALYMFIISSSVVRLLRIIVLVSGVVFPRR